MTEPMNPSATLDAYLSQHAGASSLSALQLLAEFQRAAESKQRHLVQAAVESHSWSEIGAALGISKQAAHHKYVKLLAEDLKTRARDVKSAKRAGQPGASLAAQRDLRDTAATLRATPAP